MPFIDWGRQGGIDPISSVDSEAYFPHILIELTKLYSGNSFMGEIFEIWKTSPHGNKVMKSG